MLTLADLRASIFASAPPLPPDMMAPAWPVYTITCHDSACRGRIEEQGYVSIEMELPILLPGGAVSPAIKAATGFALGPCTDRERDKVHTASRSLRVPFNYAFTLLCSLR